MRRGDLIAERFEIELLAGTGGMGEVYRAFDHVTREVVALKLLVGTEEARFELEARVLSSLRHPGVVRYVAHGATDDGDRYLAMEWLDGEDLGTRLLRGTLSVEESVTLGSRIAEALAATHAEGVVHRDIKPENLFLVNREIERVKLLDFGIVRVGLPRDTQSGMVLGTLGYMAPEQARGSLSIDSRADVFALGSVLYECLTGTQAFASEDLMALLVKIVIDEVPRVSERGVEVPQALDDLVAAMLSKDPDLRPRDGAAVAAQLAATGLIEGPRSRAMPQSRLTQGEQRLLSVVLVTDALDLDADPTLQEVEVTERIAVLRQVVEGLRGRLEALADGSLAVTLLGTGIATDQAARAAQCALSLRILLRDKPMALATGWGEVTGKLPVGEVVDRAARMLRRARALEEMQHGGGDEGAARHDESQQVPARPIAIDEVTAGLLDMRFEVTKGIRGLELRGDRPLVEGSRTLLGKPIVCVGRERELATLDAIFVQCSSESVSRVVLLTSPAGLGKTRVGYEFVQALRRTNPDVEVWFGRGDPIREGSAFSLLSHAIRHAAGLVDGEPLPVRQQKLRARVARWVPESERVRVTEFLGELVGAPFPDEESVQLRAARREPTLMGDQLRRAWEDFARYECETHPVVLVLEDLHWGDLPTVKLVDAALRTLRHLPMMVLAIGRPEVHELFPKLWVERGVQELRLGELTPKASEKLVRQALGENVSPKMVQRLVEQADGHAFYLEELIRAVAGGDRDALPSTVIAMVQARLDELDPDARRVLRAASVFGQTFWKGGVTALLGGAQVEWRLARLTEQEVISLRAGLRFTGEEEFTFRHAMMREAAYATLTDEDRRLGHRLAGEWLARAGETDAMVLAGHFEKGKELARAIGWYRRAAEQAYEGNDLDALLARAARGVACGAHGEDLGALRLLQAEAHRWRGEPTEAEQRSSEAMERLREGTALWYGAAREVIFASSVIGRIDRLLEVIHLVQAQPLDEAVAGARLAALGFAYDQLIAAGRHDLAAELYAPIDALVGLDAARDPAAQAVIHDVRANHALHAGDPSTFFELMEASFVSSVQAGDLRSACVRRMKIGCAKALVGVYDESERMLRESIAGADQMGLHALSLLADHHLGLVLARQGRLDEARSIEAGAMLMFSTQSSARREGNARVYLAMILLLLGEEGSAELQARTAVELLAKTPTRRAVALATLAEVLIVSRRPGDALAAATEAVGLLAPAGVLDEGESQVRLVHAEALAATGDHAGARVAIGAARERLLARAAVIHDRPLRDGFLTRIPENARTIDLAQLWLDQASAAGPIPPTSSERRSVRPPAQSIRKPPEPEAQRCLQAAEEALARGNTEAAFAHAEQGMTHIARGEVRAQLHAVMARAYGWRNVWTPAKRWAEEGMSQAKPASRGWCAALSAKALACSQLGNTDELVSAAAALHDLAPAEDAAAALAITHAVLSMALGTVGEKSLAEDCAERMERLGAPSAGRDLLLRGWMNRARAARARAGEEDPWTALRLDMAAQESFDEAGDASEAALSLALLGIDCWLLGAYERSATALRGALDSSGQRGYLTALTTIYLAWTLADDGKLAQAGGAIIMGFNAERSRGNPSLKAAASCAFAEILRRRGNLEGAEHEAQAALALSGIAPLERTTTLATLASIRLSQGRLAEGLDLARKARAEREALRAVGFKDAFVRLVHIEALIANDDLSGVRMPLSRARNRLLVRAAKIGDPTLRESFLERVPENARTVTLAQQILGAPDGTSRRRD